MEWEGNDNQFKGELNSMTAQFDWQNVHNMNLSGRAQFLNQFGTALHFTTGKTCYETYEPGITLQKASKRLFKL